MGCNYLREQWVNQMTRSLVLSNPDKKESEIREFVEKQYDDHYTEHKACIYNSYENITYDTTLGECVDWIQSFRPLIAESGVFFYPKSMKRNLNTEIIKESMLDARTVHKAEKFAALDAGDTFLAAVKDSQQLNDKKAANSGYGAEGQRSSFLFNMHSAMSVTASGRGQLSTAGQCIENIMADYVKFFDMNEFFTWIDHIVQEKPEWKFDAFDVIDQVPSKSQWVKRYTKKFLHHGFCNEEMLENTYDKLTDELRIRSYYKSNMYEFFRNFIPKQLFTELYAKDCKFHKKNKDGTEKAPYFVDPNDVPDSMKDDLELMIAMVLEFVGYQYGVFRYEDRFRYQKRACVPVSDTDS